MGSAPQWPEFNIVPVKKASKGWQKLQAVILPAEQNSEDMQMNAATFLTRVSTLNLEDIPPPPAADKSQPSNSADSTTSV